MSLLLDALNKTSAKSSTTEDSASQRGALSNSELSAEFEQSEPSAPLSSEHTSQEPEQKDSSHAPGISSSELELEPQHEAASETELDAELSIDDAALDSLVNEHPADTILETAVGTASELAVDEASQQAVEESIEATLEEMEKPRAEVDRPSVEDLSPDDSEPLVEESAQSTAYLEGDLLLSEDNDTPNAAPQGLIIEAEAEPASLAEEILHDAPLVAAYAKAQRRRKILISGALATVICLLCAFTYKTFFYTPNNGTDTAIAEPEIGVAAETQAPAVTLEPIKLNQIPARRSFQDVESDKPVNTIQVSRQPVNSTALNSAYQALQTGQLDKASVLYSRLLQNPLTKADALAGLASVSIARADFGSAKKFLNELLVVDSSNTYALSVLAAMASPSSDESADVDDKASLLKSLQYSNPKNADIAYLLGNQLAAKSNWPEAQRAYFSAHSLDPKNPIYALNLAISMDQLGKPQQARDLYNIALRNAPKASAQIDINAITRRLEQGN